MHDPISPYPRNGIIELNHIVHSPNLSGCLIVVFDLRGTMTWCSIDGSNELVVVDNLLAVPMILSQVGCFNVLESQTLILSIPFFEFTGMWGLICSNGFRCMRLRSDISHCIFTLNCRCPFASIITPILSHLLFFMFWQTTSCPIGNDSYLRTCCLSW